MPSSGAAKGAAAAMAETPLRDCGWPTTGQTPSHGPWSEPLHLPHPRHEAVCSPAQMGFTGGSVADIGGVEMRNTRRGPKGSWQSVNCTQEPNLRKTTC